MLHTASIKFTKKQLQELLSKFMNENYTLYWRYLNMKVILVIDTGISIVQLPFTKEKDNVLTLNKSSLDNVENVKIKDLVNDFLIDNNLTMSGEMNETASLKTEKHLKIVIDYHLMELHDYIQSKNAEMINKTKELLYKLTNQLNELQ